MTMSADQSNLNLKLKQSRRYLKSDTESTIFAQLEIFSMYKRSEAGFGSNIT